MLLRKVFIAVVSLLLIFSTTSSCWAAPIDYFGGVNDEYNYEEMVFVSGEPIRFLGTYTSKVSDKTDTSTTTLDFKLNGYDLNGTSVGTLKRTMKYTTAKELINDKGQTINTTILDSFKESILINGYTYTLKDYQFSKSAVVDNRPASDFLSGNIQGRKYYEVDQDGGVITVDVSGGEVGYSNFWGNTNTQLINLSITGNILPSKRKKLNVSYGALNITVGGTVNIYVSDSQTKSLQYYPNDANYASFDGGYVRTTNRDMITQYNYDITKDFQGTPVRYRDSEEFSKKNVPIVERLVLPKFRDISGHPAEEAIKKLYSLDVYNNTNIFFSPDTPMRRGEFVHALMQACNIRIDTTANQAGNTTTEEFEFPFTDVAEEDENYQEISDAVQKGVVYGKRGDTFRPEEPITVAEAITIIVRALGFENKAPAPGYTLDYVNSDEIPYWAQDSFYIATEIGLIGPDAYNMISPGPNETLTRGNASKLMVAFLKFLEKDLQKDYRDQIIYDN